MEKTFFTIIIWKSKQCRNIKKYRLIILEKIILSVEFHVRYIKCFENVH